MSFRRPSYFDPLSSRRMYGAGNMLIEPWIDEPVLPLLSARPFASSLMSSVFDILEPLVLLDRMDRMINRLIGGGVIRRRPIRRRLQPMGFRGIRPTIQAAPKRRRVRRVRRAVSVTRRPQRVQPMLPQQMRQKRRGSLRRQAVQPQMQQRRRSRSRSVQRSVSQQPSWQQWQQPQQIGGIRGQQRQPSIRRQVSVQRQPSIGRQVSVQRQPSIGRQISVQRQPQQQPIQQQQQKQRLPQTQMGQQKLLLGRQVPIQQQQQVKKQPKQQQSGVATTSGIGKLSKAAQPVTGVKLPQLYRICLDARDCNPKDIKCNVQTAPSGQCNLLITGCGPFRRCYTLPNSVDYKKMKKHVTPQNMYVIECPLVETPRCLDISMQPQIKQDCVALKVNIPEFIDPNKVQVNLKDNDLILRFETKLEGTTECACRVHYYNKVTLPAQTNLDMLKCQCVRGSLCITAPIIGAKKQPVQPQQPGVSKLPQVGAGKEVSGEIQPEKKMRHRKREKMEAGGAEQQQVVQKGVQPTPTKATKLPKPEDISIGVQKPTGKRTGKPTEKPTGKTAPGAPVTPTTTPVTKPKKEKGKQPTEAPVSGGEVKGEVKQPTKKEGKKGKKGAQQGQQEQQGRISSGVQQIHEIFASSGTSASQGQQQQQQPPQQETSEESMGRPVSSTKA